MTFKCSDEITADVICRLPCRFLLRTALPPNQVLGNWAFGAACGFGDSRDAALVDELPDNELIIVTRNRYGPAGVIDRMVEFCCSIVDIVIVVRVP